MTQADPRPDRVRATPAALELLAEIQADHGPVLFHQSGGCCDGSSPMCYPQGDFIVSERDVLLGEIGNVGKLHKPRVEQAGFAVLKAPDIPSVLVETAFISNPEEEARLRSSAYQQQLADALMRGITRYFAKNPPLARSRSV